MILPHVFKHAKTHGQCATCGGWSDADYHNLELFSGVDLERHEAKQLDEAEKMTRTMRTPLRDVSKISAAMERESPLFFGIDAHPSLFQLENLNAEPLYGVFDRNKSR